MGKYITKFKNDWKVATLWERFLYVMVWLLIILFGALGINHALAYSETKDEVHAILALLAVIMLMLLKDQDTTPKAIKNAGSHK